MNAAKAATHSVQSSDVVVDVDVSDADAATAAGSVVADVGVTDVPVDTTADDALGVADPEEGDPPPEEHNTPERRISWSRLVAFGLMPVLALLLAAGAGYLKYRDFSIRDADVARIQSVQAASQTAVALLSYGPDDVEAKLTAAQDRLTGTFRDSYALLIKDVVIPGAKRQHIAATATVPAAASVSATSNHAEVLVFVNQAVIVGNDAPTGTASAIDVSLDKVGDRWLISGFDPK
jgi:Mce-associated membrane protein